MAKMPVSALKPGMKLAKPIVNDAGMILLGEGSWLTDTLIERLLNMNIGSVYVEGTASLGKSKEEMLAELDARFKKTESEPYMGTLKKLLKEHIEELFK